MSKGKKTGGRVKNSVNKNRIEVVHLIDALAKKRYGPKGKEFVFSQLFALAEGIWVESPEDDGIKYYQKEPNVKALEILAGYRHGKPPQSVDVTSMGEKLSLQIVYEK
jgi:hypothetical protein